IPINPVDISKINILMNILGNGFNSLLFKELREKERLIYGLSTKLEGHYITNYLKIEYNVDKSKKDFSIACVNNCINKLKSGDFDKDLIDIFKARELPGLIVDVKKVGTIHDYLKIENMGNINTKKYDIINQIESFWDTTKEDIIRVANEYLNDNKLVISIE
ncbi:MAG TPA: insulinase family protein, partial [Candidatus Nanoarchaeia archaeon]|nr:insulinase family protein [Candidatus Nanoarchaeia archaeon]